MAKFSFGFLVERTMAVQENSHTATNKGYLTSFKKTTNPNVSPIGKRFGSRCFGAGDRTWTCTCVTLDPKSSASANSATPAYLLFTCCQLRLTHDSCGARHFLRCRYASSTLSTATHFLKKVLNYTHRALILYHRNVIMSNIKFTCKLLCNFNNFIFL